MARHVRMSPQKVRLVVDLIRGQRAEDALQILRFTKKRATRDVEKVLRSAIANAERKAEDAGASLDVDHLFVSNCFVNEGSRWKRLRPAPMGRAFRYQRRTSHIVVGVAEHHRRRAGACRRRGRRSGIAEGRRGSGEEGSPGASRKEKAGPQSTEEVAEEERLWDRRHIHTGSAWATTSPGNRAGTPTAITPTCLHEDVKLRSKLKDRLKSAGISSIDIERAANKLVVRLFTARPGIIIGRKGAEIDKLKGEIQKRTKREVHIDIQEVHRPELDAQLVAESIALQLEKRVAFRRAMRKAVDSALRFGCKGIKIRVAGRLNGAEIARKEWYLQGRLPLQTLRADIDYGIAEALHDLRRDWREVLGLSGRKRSPARDQEARSASGCGRLGKSKRREKGI